jgi:two-component system LytT family sensor kinase
MIAEINDPRRRAVILLVLWFIAWTLIGFVLFGQDFAQNVRTHRGDDWHPLLECWLIHAYTWALLGLAVRWLSTRLPIAGRSMIGRIALHIPLGGVVALAAVASVTCIGSLLQIPWYQPTFGSSLPAAVAIGLPMDLFTYWLLLCFWETLRGYDRYRQQKQFALQSQLQMSELKTQLATAQLTALKNQLQPHFLFNALNGVMALVRRRDTEPAEQMLAQLGDLLRRVLRDSHALETTLQAELELVRLYLGIEEIRFQNRLQVAFDVSPELLRAMVPNMCLQPLVENAIRHGLGGGSNAGQVRIHCSRSVDSLRIEVHDSGSHVNGSADGHSPGIGLANTRARLQGLYGDEGQVRVEARAQGGTVAILVIPYRPVAPNLMPAHSLP